MLNPGGWFDAVLRRLRTGSPRAGIRDGGGGAESRGWLVARGGWRVAGVLVAAGSRPLRQAQGRPDAGMTEGVGWCS